MKNIDPIVDILAKKLHQYKETSDYYTGWNDAIRKVIYEIEAHQNNPVQILRLYLTDAQNYIKYYATKLRMVGGTFKNSGYTVGYYDSLHLLRKKTV